MDAPSLKGELRELIGRYLELPIAAEALGDGIRTGHPYQSVRLGDLDAAGARSHRDEFLDRIDLGGKRVLDLGSNLGELSRGARERGASIVDGFERDPFFLEVASAIDAYRDITRVSYYERDIGDPAVYREHYDVVFAFSVFSPIRSALDRIAEITDELLLLETHGLRAERDLEAQYVHIVGRYFPHFAILGGSEWVVKGEGDVGHRAVVAFAKDEGTLLRLLKEPLPGTAPPNVVRTAAAQRPGRRAEPRLLQVDLTKPPRDALQRFFTMFRFDSLDELLDAVGRMQIDVDTLAKSRDPDNRDTEGWVHWLLFTKGYLQYLESGELGEGNAYLDYLSGRGLATDRIADRYRDLDSLRRQRATSTDPPPGMKPVTVTVGDVPRVPPLAVYEVGAERPLPVRNLDGSHRLFAARLAGFESFPCEAVPENLHDLPVCGAVERFGFEGERLRLEGWYLDPEGRANHELRLGGLVLATGGPVERADSAGASRFEIEVECPSPSVPTRFDLIVMHGIVPVGAIQALHLPGEEWGPEQALVYRLLRPLARRRALDAFSAILECRGAGPALAPALGQLLPTAAVRTVGAGDVGQAPPHGADLVIADEVLTSLGPDDQLAFLQAVREAVGPVGFVAATVSDEAALEACATNFEVVDFVKGGAANLQDLAILRNT